MSVTIYLTDHNGRKVAFFYRIDSERYLTCPQLIWACRDYPEYQGRAESKEDFMEQCKSVMKELNKISQKTCSTCEKIPCDTCGLTSPKMEAQSTCPQCLINDQ
jgi:hypothetical protein